MQVYDRVIPYEVYWCDLPVAVDGMVGGRRPCIVISNEKEAISCTNILVVPTTSNIKRTDLPCNVLVSLYSNSKSMAMCNQIRNVPKTWLREYIGRLTPSEIRDIHVGLMIELGFIK